MSGGLLPVMLSALAAASSGLRGGGFCRFVVTRDDSALETHMELSSESMGRLSFGFDPAVESLEIVSSSVVRPGGESPLPSWALDTLSGTGGWPLAACAVFPPGAAGRLVVERRSWDRITRLCPSAVLFPPLPSCSVEVVVEGGREDVSWSGEGYSRSFRGRDLVLRAGPQAGPVAVSWAPGWGDLRDAMLSQADSVLALRPPAGVREAAIEAGAAGADPVAGIRRLRTILCNSIEMTSAPRPLGSVRPLADILSTREADALEAAVIFSAICSGMGIPCSVVPASAAPRGIPVAADWDRVLVRMDLPGGRVFAEPSALLVPALFVAGADSLLILGEDGPEPLPSFRIDPDICSENWDISASGRFHLRVSSSGAFDPSIRRRLAGLSEARAAASVSSWLWRGGFTAAVDSVAAGDLYDLAVPACFDLWGSLPPSEGGYIVLPGLAWDAIPGGTVRRAWTIPAGGAAYPADLAASPDRDGRVVLSDTLPVPVSRLVRIEDPPGR